jgi:hypothetical protein
MSNPFQEEVFEKQPENALSIVVLKATKENIEFIANNIIEDIRENDEDYLKAYIQAKGIEEVAKAIQEGIKKDAMDEADKFEKDQKFEGCTVVVKGLADKYSFEGDEEWVRLTKQEAEIKKRKKEIETLMIQASKFSELTDKDGVVITPATLKERGGNTISVTLPKK